MESHHVLEVVTDLMIHFIQGIGEMSRREMDIPGHVGTRVEIEQGALFNSLDKVFGYVHMFNSYLSSIDTECVM